MTMLYQRVVMWLARRYDTKFRLTPEEKAQGINPATMPKIQILERCKEELQTLAKLAYDGFVNHEIQTLSHKLLIEHFPDQSKLHRITAEFGVLRKETASQARDEYPKHYFIHLTYQEYFAALYMAQRLSQKPSQDRAQEILRRQKIQEIVRFIVDNRSEQRCAVVWIFLAGLVSTQEYMAGADYFWDALIDLESNSKGGDVFIGLHWQTKVLQNNQRVLREALLTHQAFLPETLVLPKRLERLKAQIGNMMQWQYACQTKNLLPMWDDDRYFDKPSLKQRQQYQQSVQQYQSDAAILGFVITKPLVISLFWAVWPSWVKLVAVKKAELGDSNKDVRIAAARALGQMGVSDEASLSVLRGALRDRDGDARKAAATSLKHLAPMLHDAPTIRLLLKKAADTKEDNIETIHAVYIALARIHPKTYITLPELPTHPNAHGFFILSLLLHSSRAFISIKNKQLTIDHQVFSFQCAQETFNTFVSQIQPIQEKFIAIMASPELRTILQALTQSIDLPIITNVFNEDFLTKDLPEETILHESHINIRLQAVESKTDELDRRVEGLAIDNAYTSGRVTVIQRLTAKHTDTIETLQEAQKPSAKGVIQFGITAKSANDTQRSTSTANTQYTSRGLPGG